MSQEGRTEPMWAFIFNPWKDQPVYHALSREDVSATRCGRFIGAMKPGFPMKHAKKFGRPCKGCFP